MFIFLPLFDGLLESPSHSQSEGMQLTENQALPTMETFTASLQLRYIIIFMANSSGMWMTVISPPSSSWSSLSSLLPAVSSDGNRKAIGRRVPSNLFALAMAMDLKSRSAISRGITLTSLLAAASCLVAPFGRSERQKQGGGYNLRRCFGIQEIKRGQSG